MNLQENLMNPANGVKFSRKPLKGKIGKSVRGGARSQQQQHRMRRDQSKNLMMNSGDQNRGMDRSGLGYDDFEENDGEEDDGDEDNQDGSGKPKAAPPPPAYLPPWSQEVEKNITYKEALIKHVARQSCHEKTDVTKMKIKRMVPKLTYHYSLESFYETREIISKHEPIEDEATAQPKEGEEPSCWDIVVKRREPFCEGVEVIELPNSLSIKTCWGCKGFGKKECKHGFGKRKNNCESCQGQGGFITCNVCEGFCKLKTFKQVIVKWSTHRGDHVYNETEFPSKKIKKVSGLEVLCQQDKELLPLINIPYGRVNHYSLNEIQKHAEDLEGAVIHMQRQSVRAIPVTEVEIEWKSHRNFRFWIYGEEERVHCPKCQQGTAVRCCIL